MVTPAASAASHPKPKRSIWIIKRSLQFRYVAVVFLAILVACAIMGFHFYFSITRRISIDLGYAELHSVLVEMNITLVIVLLIYAVIVLVFAILISHKFAGPIYRFEKSFDALAAGDLTHRITLRKGDELGDLRDNINIMISSLHLKVKKDREKVAHLIGRVEECLQTAATNGPDCRDRLKTILSELRHITETFKI